jgi:hypothetical protein
MDSDMVKKRIQTYVVRETGGTLDFRKAELVSFPLPHITFRQVSFSVPDKATGLVQSLDVYPDIWSLIRGDVTFSKLRIESPRFTVALSEDMEKPSLEEIEEKIRSFVHVVTAIAPDLYMTVQGGKLNLTKNNRVAFSFDTIQSRVTVSGELLNVSLSSTSNLWGKLSLHTSLHAGDLKSDGNVQVRNLRPHTLFNQLFPKISEYTGDSDADLSVKFRTLGLRQIKAEAESSVPDLVLVRGKNRVKIEDLRLKGDIEIEPQRVSVMLREFDSAVPDFTVSGNYTLDRTSGIMELDLKGKSIDLQSTRRSALSLAGDIPVLRNIFDIVQGGSIPSLHFHASGKSPDDLARLHNMRISGRMLGGEIYIRARDLRFHDVSGDVIIAEGVLRGEDIGASLENHQGSQGKLTIGLKGKDAPFRLDMWVKADVSRLPSLLKEKSLVKNEAVLREMDRLSETRGSAEGRLILGERLDSLHAVVDVSQINLVTRYEPLPFPLMIKGGKTFFDEKSLKTTNLSGTLGKSSFTNVTAELNLDDTAGFDIADGQLSVNSEEMYPWITSFEKIKPVLKDVPSMSGLIAVSSLDLKGSLHHPEDWMFTVNGETKKFTIDAKFFPGKAEETSGTFRITQDELFLKDVRTRMIDSSFAVSGTVREFPANVRKLDLSVQGEAGPKVTAWISALIQLPPDISVRAPLSFSDSTLVWEKERKTTFDGRLVFGRETQVSLKLTKTPDALSVHDITIKDRDSDVAASLMMGKKTVDVGFRGTLTSGTFNTIFAQNKFSGSSLQGDFRTHIILKDPRQSVAEGIIEGRNIPVPWKNDIPFVIQRINLDARGQRVLVESAQLSIGDEQFSGKGTIDTSPAWFSIDMDLSSKGFNWETIEKIVSGTKGTEERAQPGFLEQSPLKGTVRIQSDFFTYRQFTWEPFHADVSFDEGKLHISAKKAALCGISTTGDVAITDQDAEIDIALSAKNLELQPTILCISDKKADITGRFEMKADLRAKGKLDTIAKSLNGSFTISAKKGKIYKSQSLNRTLDLVNETENVKEKLPDLDKTIIDYRGFTASGTIKEHILDIEESVLDASSFGVLARGKVDLQNQTLDLNALVAPVNRVQRIVGKIPILGHVLGGSLVSVPVKIKGNLSDPQVTFLSPSAVGSAFLGIMERTIKLPITIIEPVLPSKK